jgi:hypothetical protein
MEKAKIRSTKTYSKTLSELAEWGYLKYVKSTSRIYGSKIYMFPTGSISKQVIPPFYKHINNKHIYTEDKNGNLFQNKNFNNPGPTNVSQNENPNQVTPPPLQHVKIYFNEKGAPEIEAKKFFNHYEARGWLNNSLTPILNWKASARNWILNIPKFNPKRRIQRSNIKKTNLEKQQKPGNHHLNQNKDYDTPL